MSAVAEKPVEAVEAAGMVGEFSCVVNGIGNVSLSRLIQALRLKTPKQPPYAEKRIAFPPLSGDRSRSFAITCKNLGCNADDEMVSGAFEDHQLALCHPLQLLAAIQAHPRILEKHHVATIWKNDQGEWCYLALYIHQTTWYIEIGVCRKEYGLWDRNWQFAYVPHE